MRDGAIRSWPPGLPLRNIGAFPLAESDMRKRSKADSVFAAAVLWSSVLLSPSAHAQTTAFRINDMDLRDPHIVVSLIGCNDITGTLNSELQTRIQTDGDTPPDGLLDLSSLLLFTPLDQSLLSNTFDYGNANCSAPLAGTSCTAFGSAGLSGNAVLQSQGICLQPVTATTSGYSPPVSSASSPCFASPQGTLTLDLGGIAVPLSDAQIAATFVDVPATSLINGLLLGFVAETDADAAIIPADIPLIGGRPLSSVLPGGTGSCRQTPSDKDLRNGVPGWWFYLNFSASVVPLLQPDGVFVDGFED